jgi:IS30 family transposase
MVYKHLSQTEQYQIYVLMKAGMNLQAIAQILSRHQSTIGWDVLRHSGLRGYRLRQVDHLSQQCAHAIRSDLQFDDLIC